MVLSSDVLWNVRVATCRLQDGYDLDLVYLTERIIIMGFPATGIGG